MKQRMTIRNNLFDTGVKGATTRMDLHKLYRPITATPFRSDDNYIECAPCDALKPYIRCFWGTPKPVRKAAGGAGTTEVVVPDTCMDIIFDVDYTNNRIANRFCGIDERTFLTHNADDGEKTVSRFAIRFYAWSAVMFADESLRGTKNGFFDADCHFSRIRREVEPLLTEALAMDELVPLVERVLLGCYDHRRRNRTVLQAVRRMLMQKGNVGVHSLAQDMQISDRQLERLFKEYIGVTPKSLAAMVRYQYLWNDILYDRKFQIQDAVYQYGYSDQAHLYHDFKKYHSMNLTDARAYALQNVGNIQEKPVGF